MFEVLEGLFKKKEGYAEKEKVDANVSEIEQFLQNPGVRVIDMASYEAVEELPPVDMPRPPAPKGESDDEWSE